MGLWHGASWTFVFWGIYHASFIYIHRVLSSMKRFSNISNSSFAILITLPTMMLGWISFRAEDLSSTFILLSKVFIFGEYFSLGLRENSYIVAFILTISVLLAKPTYHYFSTLQEKKKKYIHVFDRGNYSLLLICSFNICFSKTYKSIYLFPVLI